MAKQVDFLSFCDGKIGFTAGDSPDNVSCESELLQVLTGKHASLSDDDKELRAAVDGVEAILLALVASGVIVTSEDKAVNTAIVTALEAIAEQYT